MQGSVSTEDDLDQASGPLPLHKTSPSTITFTEIPRLALHCHLTSQSRANRKWRVVQQVDYMDSTKCLLGARSLRKCPLKSNANSKLIYSHSFTIPIRINPLLQRPASINANSMTICPSNSNWPNQSQLNTILRLIGEHFCHQQTNPSQTHIIN